MYEYGILIQAKSKATRNFINKMDHNYSCMQKVLAKNVKTFTKRHCAENGKHHMRSYKRDFEDEILFFHAQNPASESSKTSAA